MHGLSVFSIVKVWLIFLMRYSDPGRAIVVIPDLDSHHFVGNQRVSRFVRFPSDNSLCAALGKGSKIGSPCL